MNERDYGNHLSILKLLPKIIPYPIITIVEFGCGMYSTPIFLERVYYPHVSLVVSLESDKRPLYTKTP